MNIDYYVKIQNAYGTKSKREKELAKTNRNLARHFDDTYDSETVLVNGQPMELMIIHDTENNVFKRKIKSKHEDKFNLGDYVEWKGQTWLINILDSDDKTWNRGQMVLCTVVLRWQDNNGKIIERYAYSEDFTKYSEGVDGNKIMTVGDYQYGMTLPVDEDTKIVKRDKRFPVDLEGVEPPDIYMLTNRKVLLSDDSYFKRGGILVWTLSFNAFNKDTDKKITLDDNREVWICDYKEPTTPLTPSEPVQSNILSVSYKGKPELKIGSNFKKFEGIVQDLSGDTTSDIGTWDVDIPSEIVSMVTYEIEDNIIKLKVEDNDDAIGKPIQLKFSVGDDSVTLDLKIVNIF